MTAAERGAGAQETRLVALAGNPNVGKSTIFNALTGMHQHTGNWPGKTVALAQGTCRYKDTEIRLVDLPGTYALVSKSQEEALAAGFVSGGEADCVIAVCDATSLERSLILALQVLELTDRACRLNWACPSWQCRQAGKRVCRSFWSSCGGFSTALRSRDRAVWA